MKQHLSPHRRAAALLLAAAALPLTPLAAQDVPTVNAPPPVTAPAPAPTPAPAQTPVMGPTAPVRGPTVEHVGSAPGQSAATTRAAPAPRAAVRTARAAPARQAAPVRAPAPAAAAPASAPAAAPAPAPAAPAVSAGASSQVVPVTTPAAAAPATEPAATVTNGVAPWQWALAIAAIAIIAVAAAMLIARRRRRAEEEYYDETYCEEPAYAEAAEPAPAVAAEPVLAAAAVAEEVKVAESDRADVDALAASSEPVPNRPWLEFLMRPVRAGTSEDEARVEFELTVGNTGSVPARDVRVSTWMVAGGEGTDMERSLIEPPADAALSELSIDPGDGARVDGTISVPTERLHGAVLPVVVADARYRLPDGSEGRTHASFAVGLPSGDGLAPFDTDHPSGIRDDVEARLHGEPERV
ncbi:MAG: hypothetical protein JO276_05570 [Sphingomonadaceae bacterium]|nr:hypothetical protein [Sphingomonadaceae bacterium]